LLFAGRFGFRNLRLLVIGLFGQFFDGHGGSAVSLTTGLRTDGGVEAPLDGQGNVLVYRAGVRLLLLDAKLRQQLQYFIGLDFQLPGQLIDSDFQLHR
jgi:hypothetical protein